MAKFAVDRFIALVERSGLVETVRLGALVSAWKQAAGATELDDAAHLGRFLAESGALTPWQCHKLLEGRHRGFMLGNYKLLDHLGSGGMSNVYLAEHVLMQRRVAIKVLPEHRVSDAEYVARFHFEGQAVAALDHPNIVRAYDLGSEGKIHYLVMEYVEGSDLEALVDRHGPMPAHVAANYIAQAATGLEHAHHAGLIHRDVKPANLLVNYRGVVKVLDLGLAKSTAETHAASLFSREDQVLGTAAYFAPEQATSSNTVDARADIYGLGCTLYFLLTGHPPFGGTTTSELMRAHQRELAASISIVRPEVALELIKICERMMAKRADDRYQSAREVATAIANWLKTERLAGRLDEAAEAKTWLGAEVTGLRDTTPNLQDTSRVVRQHSSPSSHVISKATGTGSDRLVRGSDASEPPPAPTPPAVPPPRQSGEMPTVSVVWSAPQVPRAVVLQQSSPHANINLSARKGGSLRPRRRLHRAQLWWAGFVAALVLSAALLAIIALT
jgi:serine/threonine protein kinase